VIATGYLFANVQNRVVTLALFKTTIRSISRVWGPVVWEASTRCWDAQCSSGKMSRSIALELYIPFDSVGAGIFAASTIKGGLC
jgi:hypothetical protein